MEVEKNAGIPDGLGCCYHAVRDYENALLSYDEAVKMDPSNTGFLMHRASCNYDQKSYQKSIVDLLLGLEKTPSDPKILYQLGLSYYADTQYKQCIKTLKRALLNKPVSSYESDLYYHIGLSYCLIEKYEKAIYPLTKCLELVPSNVKYIHERAKAY